MSTGDPVVDNLLNIYLSGGSPVPSQGGSQGSSGGGNKPPTVPPAPPTPGSGDSGSSAGAYNGSPNIDLFGTSSGYYIARQPAGQNYMTSYQVRDPNNLNQFLPVIRSDLYCNDYSGGMDAQIRQIKDGVFTNEVAASFVNLTHSRTAILPPLVTSDAGATNSIGTLEAMSSCYLNDGGTPRWLASAGDTANKALFALTSSVTAQTYTPGSNIVSLTTAKIATNTERVIVGRAGAAAQVLTGFNGTPTTSGTMHANTTGLWGAIRTGLNSSNPGYENILLYCNDSLYILGSNAAIGDAPTAVLTNWPGGGYALGITTLATDNVARAYWVHPLNDSSTSILDTAAPGRIVSTNLEGTDAKYINTGLPFIKHALIWGSTIVATDGKQVVIISGDGQFMNLGWNRERRWELYSELGSAGFGFGVVQGLAVIHDRLLVGVATITTGTGDQANPNVWEEFIPESNTWQFFAHIAPGGDATATGNVAGLLPNISLFTGNTPVYEPYDTGVDAGYFYWYAKVSNGSGGYTYEWQNIALLPSGVNPTYQQTESSFISYSYDSRAVGMNYFITPEYQCYEGLPKIVSDIWYGGKLRGEDSKIKIEIANQGASSMNFLGGSEATQAAVFVEDNDWRRNWWFNTAPEGAVVDRLQFRVVLYRGTSGAQVAKATPNALPFRIGFYTFLDGVPRDPKVMEPHRYWGEAA